MQVQDERNLQTARQLQRETDICSWLEQTNCERRISSEAGPDSCQRHLFLLPLLGELIAKVSVGQQVKG